MFMNRFTFLFLTLFFLLAGCSNAPIQSPTTATVAEIAATDVPATDAPNPTASPTQITSATAETESAPPTVTAISTSDIAATDTPPAGPTAEPTPSPAPDTTTIFTDYKDTLRGIATQRPIEWTVHFPQENLISSYVAADQLPSDPAPSYADFSYEIVGQFTELGQPDLTAMLLGYLQQNVSAEIARASIHSLTLASYPAVLWRTEFGEAGGLRRNEEQWLLFNRPNIYRIKTVSQIGADGKSYDGELQKMLQSLQFSEPSLLRGTLQVGRFPPYVANNVFYTSSSNGVAFSYPPGGLVNDVPGDIAVVSDQALYDGFDADEVGYAVYYRKLAAGSAAEPSLELAQSLVKLPDTTARQVDRNTVDIDRYSAEAILYRNRPDNRFTYELAVYVINQSDGQYAIVSVKYGNAAPAIWNEGVIGSILFGP